MIMLLVNLRHVAIGVLVVTGFVTSVVMFVLFAIH